MVKLNKTDKNVVAALEESGELTLQELAEKTGETSKKVFKSLKKLFENELIETKARKYKIATKPSA
jgi:predicted transcriptional regulator